MKRLLLIPLLILVACGGEPPPSSGYVRDKRFIPAHWEDGYRTESYMDCSMHLNYEGDLEYGCRPATRSVYEPQYQWVGDRWKILLENCESTEKEDKCRTGWKVVDETTYHDYGVGQHYPDPR